MLNILLSFAQFERELSGERIRDKFAASIKKGMWMGGTPPLGYEVKNRSLLINEEEKPIIKFIYEKFAETEQYFMHPKDYYVVTPLSKLLAKAYSMDKRLKQNTDLTFREFCKLNNIRDLAKVENGIWETLIMST